MPQLRVRRIVIEETDSSRRRELLAAIVIELCPRRSRMSHGLDLGAATPRGAADVTVYVDGAEMFAGPLERMLEAFGLTLDDLE